MDTTTIDLTKAKLSIVAYSTGKVQIESFDSQKLKDFLENKTTDINAIKVLIRLEDKDVYVAFRK